MPGPGFDKRDQVARGAHLTPRASPEEDSWSSGEEFAEGFRAADPDFRRRIPPLGLEDGEEHSLDAHPFQSHFHMLRYLAEDKDECDQDIRRRMGERYGNVMIVSALIFTVAAEGMLEPSDHIMQASQRDKNVYGLFVGLAFASTLTSVLTAAILTGTIAIMPQFLSQWYFRSTTTLQKAPILLLVLGCLFLWVAVSTVTSINFGPVAGAVLWIVMVILGLPIVINYVYVLRESKRRLKEERGIEAPPM